MKSIPQLSELLKRGEIVAFPTETVYGLGALWNLPAAIKSVFERKKRPADNPLIVHISNRKQLSELVRQIPDEAIPMMDVFWPGPLTLIFEKAAAVPDIVSAGLQSVAVRMPNHPLALQLIEASGPLVGPSANLSGKPSPTRASHVLQDFGNSIEILDGGRCSVGLESTVLDIRNKPFLIYRVGILTAEKLQQHCSVPIHIAQQQENKPLPSPGMRYTHYAPNASINWLSSGVSGSKAMILLHTGESPKNSKTCIHYHGDFEKMARELYDTFREADALGIEQIEIEPLPDDKNHDVIAALRNRISKAIGR